MKQNHSSKVRIAVISLILICLVFLIARYITNHEFRNFIDINIFNKQVSSESLKYIEINSDDNPTAFAYDNYIGVLSKNKIYIYNNKGNLENDMTVNISNPVIDTNGKYAVISEKNGSRFYVINSTSLLLQEKIDGKINKISINQKGYVSIIASNSTYNSIVIIFDNDGNELFKTYFRSTYAMCAEISDSNNYLAIGEIDYSGTVIKSFVRIMDTKTAKLIYKFSAPDNEILTNIVYDNKDIATCTFSNSIYQVSNTSGSKIYSITDDNPFVNIEMENILAIIERQSSGLFSYEYQLKLKALNSNNENLYILNNGLPKSTVAAGKYIALNYGSKIDIVSQNGTLKKSYISNQQIKDVIIGSHIVRNYL